MPGFVIIKDLSSNYLNANLNTVNEFGLKNSDLLFGYSDLTIPHPLSHNGQFYRNLDLEVIQTGEPMKGICTFPFQGLIRPYRFRKSILKDLEGNNIATYSHAEECMDPLLIRFIHNLVAGHPLKHKNNKTTVTNSFILNKEYRGTALSTPESCCLFFLIRRKTISEIAGLLNLPVDVISSCVENIKNQLNANSIRDILDISIEKGYINIVPPGVLAQRHHTQNQSLSLNTQKPENSETAILPDNPKADYPVKLTNRELDCARLLMKGCKIKEIASIINLSPRTVETHINNLKMKFSCRDKVELIIRLRDIKNMDQIKHQFNLD
ncbi:response regulator transcription factor [Aquicella siphonis]|nr:helix-turn-helix transcriptional regulator [Aquicella siphonis]